MIITCPHCQTQYQVAAEAIGARGRQVQCAQCNRAWAARAPAERTVPRLVQPPPPPPPPSDAPLAEDEERQLDRRFEQQGELSRPVAEQQLRPEDSPHPGAMDPAVIRKRQRAFFKRQTSLTRQLPLARMRRSARILACLLLVGVIGGAYLFRREVVSQLPAMADVYAGLGLPVNVVGLDLRDVSIVRAVRGGASVLTVNYTLVSASSSPVAVPQVIVTLLDAAGASLLEWSVTPGAAELLPGEKVSGSTQLTAPPAGAARLRLSFGSTRSNPGGTPPAPSSPPSSGTEAETPAASHAPEHGDGAAAEPAGALPGNGHADQDVGTENDTPAPAELEHATPAEGEHHAQPQEHH